MTLTQHREATAHVECRTDHAVADASPAAYTGIDTVMAGPGERRIPMADGAEGFAREQVRAPTTSFTHAPRGCSHADAAKLATAALTTSRALLEDGALRPGLGVLVQGTGGVWVFVLQPAKLAGASVTTGWRRSVTRKAGHTSARSCSTSDAAIDMTKLRGTQ